MRSDRGMVATSQPLATLAGVRMLARGGNAADAALAAAAVLAVSEPMSTGIGGDAFALIWRDGELLGLDAAGPAPVAASPIDRVSLTGPKSVTVPGSVGGWAALADRCGRRGLDACLSDAIDIARRGFTLAPQAGRLWAEAAAPPPLPARAGVGRLLTMPDLAQTLERIAQEGPEAFYAGPVASAIAAVTWLDQSDLESYGPRWVEPLTLNYRGMDVVELPPPTQGVAALEALGILERLGPSLVNQVTAARLSLADAFEWVRDGRDVRPLLEPERLRRRSGQAASAIADVQGGTVYLCAVDDDGMAVSFIQSLFRSFGSGVLAPGTGVVLNNRGACFEIHGSVEPGRRPYNTIIPGMLFRDGEMLGPFGVMGGLIQAQAHMQFVSALVDDELDPQAALDRPRFRVDGETVRIEPDLWDRADELRSAGLEVIRDEGITPFGGGQAILRDGDEWVAGSDRRKDGYAGTL